MYESTLPACTLLRAHSSRRTSSDPRPSHVLCGPMKAAPHGAVHDAGQPHVDRTGCHARRPLGGITGAGRCGGSSAAGFRWPSLAFRSQIYYFRSSRESEARTCMPRVLGKQDSSYRVFALSSLEASLARGNTARAALVKGQI